MPDLHRHIWGTLAVCAVLLPQGVSAQTIATSFAALQKLLTTGETVFVTDTDGHRTKGEVANISPSSLIILTPAARTFATTNVSEIQRSNSLKNGALIGLVVGAAVGAAGIAAMCADGPNCGPWLGIGAESAGIGAAVGAGIDALVGKGGRVLYRSPQVARRVGISPFGEEDMQGQSASRLEVGPLVRLDQVFMEGDARGSTTVAGVVTSFRISKTYGVEAELTRALNRIERSYEARFISYMQDPDATLEEIERLAPIARRSLAYVPGLGWSAAFVARGQVSPRVSLAARVGLSARDYVESSVYTILSIPEGVDAVRIARDFRDSSGHRTRGGLLFGFAGSVAATDHLQVAPEVRFVYGGPARIGNKHREFGLGVRGAWSF